MKARVPGQWVDCPAAVVMEAREQGRCWIDHPAVVVMEARVQGRHWVDRPSVGIRVPNALTTVKERLKDDYHLPHHTKRQPEQVLELPELRLSSTCFQYKGDFFQQKHGAAMGSPVSPVYANLYMEKCEKEALQTELNPPSMWYGNMDDTMTSIQETVVDNFTQHLNFIDSCIQFTFKKEDDYKIPLLDTKVTHTTEDDMETTVYRKPTHTDLYLNLTPTTYL
ncbi:hypothetical protein ACOMHN_045284 [Nucella lapillus]